MSPMRLRRRKSPTQPTQRLNVKEDNLLGWVAVAYPNFFFANSWSSTAPATSFEEGEDVSGDASTVGFTRNLL